MILTPKNPNETGREYALRTIQDNIIRLELAPGSFISENELAAEMGLSRTPVREALMELSRVKIVTITPQKRSVVAYIDYDRVEEAQFMRRVLECAVVEQVCREHTAEALEHLEENVRLQQFYLQQENLGRVMELDDQFHGLLFEIARKPQVYEMIRHMSIHFDRVRSLALRTVKELKIVEDHAVLVQAIREGDADRAKSRMELHLNRYQVDAAAIRKTFPQYFAPEI